MISNNAPTDIALDTTATPPNATHDFFPVGKLEAVDIDYNDIHNFHIKRTSDDRFLIINGFLYSKTAIDVSTLSQYSLTIHATDLGGLSVEKTLSLDLQDTDGDSHFDADEAAAGSDPENPFSTPIGTFNFAKNLGSGWKELSWFGIFMGDNYPWIYHATLGWLLPVEDTASSLWIWHPQLGWLWTDSNSFPRMFHSNTQSWIYQHANGTFSRWNASTQNWEPL
jgi:hypothetical protein